MLYILLRSDIPHPFAYGAAAILHKSYYGVGHDAANYFLLTQILAAICTVSLIPGMSSVKNYLVVRPRATGIFALE